ncbi:acetyltransferase [Vibrio vulnificus]|nr:acetyltransferase [Vibrio vulnificus]EIF5019701.1 acetyltransferase [Vibrio vulnificus]EIO4070074.1 acetyltransferase [Vibrio vulnificus]ELH0905386.1 acetyltransferase [Vibrio vulnificus]ELV8670744.1 acetyltransferase [Vibrio vulnificus]
MVTVVVLEFGGMRCQPLRRALCARISQYPKQKEEGTKNAN